MNNVEEKSLQIDVPEYEESISGILVNPTNSTLLLVLAHGAGAGMSHPFMNELSRQLATNDIATLRFNFIYMEKGSKRPDSPKKTYAAIRAALANARSLGLNLPILLGGKSFGGRMSSQLAAQENLEEVTGLVYFGFPLHAIGKPGTDRASHLADIKLPMLFLQGTRDSLAHIPLIKSVCKPLSTAKLQIFEGADHSFKMLKRSGKTQEEIIAELAIAVRDFK